MKKVFLSICFISVLLFTGCPHQFVDMIEKNKLDNQNLNTNLKKPGEKNFISLNEKIKYDTINSPVYIDIQNINTSNFPDIVEIIATVKDSSGNFINGLAEPYLKAGIKQSDFWIKLTDSCEKVKNVIDSFSVREVRENDAAPYAVSYVLDFSGSMGIEGKKIIEAAIPKMLRLSKADDLVSVITFAGKPFLEVPLQESSVFLKSNYKMNLTNDSLGDGTKIFSAVNKAMDVLSASPDTHQRIIILLSDGWDNFNQQNWDSVIIKIRRHKIKIYTLTLNLGIGLFWGDVMANLAEISGGKNYLVSNFKQIKYIFADIYFLLKNYYIISYKAPDCRNLHKVNIAINMDTLKQGVKFTDGYYDESVFSVIDPVGTVNFLNIEFETGKAEIREESYPMLDKIVNYLKGFKTIRLKIIGHTDDIGSAEENLILSERRAESVKKYLKDNGISERRIETVGFGESKPIVPNDTDNNRQKNRRTEFEIIEK